MKMENDSESEKLGVIIFGQKFSKLEHIPIKKRILLRDSALYQRAPSSVEELDQKIGSPLIAHNSDLSGTPFVARHSDTNVFLKQEAEVNNLKPLQCTDSSRVRVVVNNVGADCHSLFPGVQNPIGFTVDNAYKDPRANASSPPTKGEFQLVSPFVPVGKGDGLPAKSSLTEPSLIGNVIEDFYSDQKSNFQPDHVSCMDSEAVQSITQDNRILWDLNVEMDAWEKPNDHLNVESEADPVTSDVQFDANLKFGLKGDSAMSGNDTESIRQPTVESMTSDGICKNTCIITVSNRVEPCAYVSKDRQVTAGAFPDKSCTVAEPSLETASINISCNHEPDFKTDERVTSIRREKTTKFFASVPSRDPGGACAALNNSIVSAEEQDCDNINIVVEGEGFANSLQVSEGKSYGGSMKRTRSAAGQLDVIYTNSVADQHEQKVSVGGGRSVTPKEKVIAESDDAAPSKHPSEELVENSPKHVDSPVLDSFQERCDASNLQSLCMPAKSVLCTTVINQLPSMDTDNLAQVDQDYEDGELRDLDMLCWNEDDTKIGETECLDYEPSIQSMYDMDESQTSVSAGVKSESGLKSKKFDLSETLIKDHLVRMDGGNMGLNGAGYRTCTKLEKKLSGWDQLPKDGHATSEKEQETHGVVSRTSRSELQNCSDIPTRSEDVEDKETVVERRIIPRDMDDTYPAESGSGFDKFSGKRRSTMHDRCRAKGWDSEHRSSVNYNDLYDDHSGARRMNINFKGREQCRSRSPYDRTEAYGPHTSYSRYSRERNGRRTEGHGRSLREGRNGYRSSLADDRSESEFCMRPRFLRRDRSFSPRPTINFSESFNRSRSRSRTRSPPLWVPPYERLGPRVHRRSPEFSADDRVKRTRVPHWKSNFPPDSEMQYTSPPQNGYRPRTKSRWNDEEDFDLWDSRDRSPVRSFHQREKFDASCSRRSSKPSEDLRPIAYRGRMREISPPGRVRGYIGGKERRKWDDSFEARRRKHYFKDDYMRRNDAECDTATRSFPLKEDFPEEDETRSVNMCKKESRKHERHEYDQLTYPGSTSNDKI